VDDQKRRKDEASKERLERDPAEWDRADRLMVTQWRAKVKRSDRAIIKTVCGVLPVSLLVFGILALSGQIAAIWVLIGPALVTWAAVYLGSSILSLSHRRKAAQEHKAIERINRRVRSREEEEQDIGRDDRTIE
jgi:small-conductance mechanosensitive channel